MLSVETIVVGLYSASILLLAGYAAHLVVLLVAAVWHRSPRPAAPAPAEWPEVLVQLPVFNERYVVERLIDTTAAFDYPPDRLFIQVLDDSTDETSALAQTRAAHHRARGVNIAYLHRRQREGFKAGALAAGLAAEPRGEFVAVFDADFVPPADFLRRLVPDCLAKARLGMVQARWEHLNADHNLLTRAQALAFDSYFTVEQVARSRAGWPLNFNGSAGVWRRACIEDSGGWQGDTLAEDFDLSYRAQLAGWQLDYRVEVYAPAELPTTILAIKRQQFRWAKGAFQVLRKLAGQWLAAPISPIHKGMGLLHLTGYLPHPLLVLSLLLSLPLVLAGEHVPQWEGLGWLSLVLPMLMVWGQRVLRRNWPRTLCYFPVILIGMIGLAFNNTWAFVEAMLGRNSEFLRTPKNTRDAAYALSLDWTTWGELLLALYALATGLLAVEHMPALVPVLLLYALSFGVVGLAGIMERTPFPLFPSFPVLGEERESEGNKGN